MRVIPAGLYHAANPWRALPDAVAYRRSRRSAICTAFSAAPLSS